MYYNMDDTVMPIPSSHCNCNNQPSAQSDTGILQHETIQNLYAQILQDHPNVKITLNKRNTIVKFHNMKISEDSFSKLNLKLKLQNDLALNGVTFGLYDDANELQNFSQQTNGIITKIIQNSLLKKLKSAILNHPNETTKDKYTSLKLGDVFDTHKIDDINSLLNNKSTLNKQKYATSMTFQSEASPDELQKVCSWTLMHIFKTCHTTSGYGN